MFSLILALTHWGRVTHLCGGNLTIIGSDNGLSPGRRQALIWTNAGILLIEPIGTNFNEIFIEIHVISFKKIYSKMSFGKWRPFCLGLNVLSCWEKSIWFRKHETSLRWCGDTVMLATWSKHDDVIKWKHFPRNWSFVREIRWISRTKASDAELWCFLWFAPE